MTLEGVPWGATPQHMGRCGGWAVGRPHTTDAAPPMLGCGGTRLGNARNGSLADAQMETLACE